jgi:Ca2+-transporting ATPase
VTAPAHATDDLRVGHEQWVFAGTRLLTGRASLLVAYTGGEASTERLSGLPKASRRREPRSSWQPSLVVALSAAALVLCAILIVVRLRQGHGWLGDHQRGHTGDSRPAEEFPVVFAFSWRRRAARLASGALVRRAVSVENIGGSAASVRIKLGRSPR